MFKDCSEWTFHGLGVSTPHKDSAHRNRGKQFLNYSLFPQQPEQLQMKSAKAGYFNTVEIFLAIISFSCHVEVEL